MCQGNFRRFKQLLNATGSYRRRRRQTHSDGAILAVHFWAVCNDRPTYWACVRSNWPSGRWRGPLPSQSCVSRRLSMPRVQARQRKIELMARPPVPKDSVTVLACLDGKPLEIAWHSGDRQSGKGRGAGHLARGYKIHTIIDGAGRLLTWRLAALNIDERTMARRLLPEVQRVCYVVADSNYNSNQLFHAARLLGMQLISPRKKSHYGKGLGNHRQDPGRLRSLDLLEDGSTPFARAMLRARGSIERYFGNLVNFGGGLTCLPSWARTYKRVKGWVTAKLTIAHLRRTNPVEIIEMAA